MRLPITLILAACPVLVGCGGSDSANDQAAVAPQPTVAAPGTPVENVTADLGLGNEESWMEPRNDTGDPAHAPYGNLLDQPLVDAPRGK